MKYELAIFDLDGTILNTIEDLQDSMNVILARHQLPLCTLEMALNAIGNGIRNFVHRNLTVPVSAELEQEMMDEFAVYYPAHCNIKTRPYDGIIEVITELRRRGVMTAVVSNKADGPVKALAQQFYEGLFDAVVGERKNVRKKPEPDSVFEVLNQLGKTVEQAVYIGDSEVDVATARNAGCDLIAVSWGFRGRQKLAEEGASCIVDTPQELLEALV